MNISFTGTALAILLILAGCSTNNAIQNDTQAAATQIQTQAPSNVRAEFYPPAGGMGDIWVVKTLQKPFRFPVAFNNIKEVEAQVYAVDEDSFFKNSIGGMASFEDHIDLSKFKQKEKIFDSKALDVHPDPTDKSEHDGLFSGYVELPITQYGYYYLSFTYPQTDANGKISQAEFHNLLEVNQNPKEFNYAN